MTYIQLVLQQLLLLFAQATTDPFYLNVQLPSQAWDDNVCETKRLTICEIGIDGKHQV